MTNDELVYKTRIGASLGVAGLSLYIFAWPFNHAALPGILGVFVYGPIWFGAGCCGWLALKICPKHSPEELARLAREREVLIAAPLTVVQPAHALLKPGERAYATASAQLREVKTVGFSAGSSGVSVRISKGVTYRTGATRGHAVKDLVTVASGELVLTDDRLVFAGDHKSFAVALDELINVTRYRDGFEFATEKATRVMITSNERERLLLDVALDKVLARRRSPHEAGAPLSTV